MASADYINMDDDPLLRYTRQHSGGGEENVPFHNRFHHVKDPEGFFRRAYKYFYAKGFGNFLLGGLCDHLNVLFLALLFLFVAGAIDYAQLYHHIHARNCPDGTHNTASLFTRDCHRYLPISAARLRTLPLAAHLALGLFLLAWTVQLLHFLARLPAMWEMGVFYRDELHMPTRRLQTISWDAVLQELVAAQRRLGICITRNLDMLDISNIIARWNNYFVALYHHEILDVSLQIPLLGRRTVLPLQLQWNIRHAMAAVLFDQHRALLNSGHATGGAAADVSYASAAGDAAAGGAAADPAAMAAAAAALAWRFRAAAVANFFLAPVILAYRVAAFVFSHAGELRGSSGRLAARQWTPYARWRLREYNEMDHAFQERLGRSYAPAAQYVGLFVSEAGAIVGQSLMFIGGGVLVVLFAMSFVLDEDFALAYLSPGRSVTWWLGTLTAVLSLARTFVPDEHRVFRPQAALREVAAHTHYYPAAWQGREEQLDTLEDFGRLFELRPVVFLQELLGVLVTPYMLWFKVAPCSAAVVRFFAHHTVAGDGLEPMASFARFGMPVGAGGADSVPGPVAPAAAAVDPAQQGARPLLDKMQHSLIAFRAQHPTWTPPPVTRAFLEDGERALVGTSDVHQSMHASLLFGDATPNLPGSSVYYWGRSPSAGAA